MRKCKVLVIMLIILSLAGCSSLRSATPTETIPPNKFRPDDFSYEDGYLECITADAVMGVDVSRYQGEIDWQQVKTAGVEFVMIRLGYRGTSEGTLNQDPMFWRNLLGARAAGLKVGAYFFSQAVNVAEAEEEAAYALKILDGISLDMPLTFDWEQAERTENMDAPTLTACTKAFCAAVEMAGYQPMIYFNSFQAKQLLHLLELQEIPWWLAMYDVTMEFPYRMDMWQYSCTGTVPGIDGSVDLNLLFENGI